jgi:hypothetical protein
MTGAAFRKRYRSVPIGREFMLHAATHALMFVT